MLVNDVLDMAKLESGRFEFHPQPTSLERWLREAVEPFVEPAALRGVAVTWSLDPRLPPQLCFDALRLHQVLANLLSNAKKFTRVGTIQVRVTARGEADAQGVPIRVAVYDTGCGIAPEAQAQLFSEFVQANAGIAASHGGTGLGLALCRQFVERMGGRIGLDSTPDVGSTFWFELTLPAVHMPVAQAG
jgi:signal transduction histidine kinase